MISTISSVCSARSAFDLNSGPMIGSLLRIGIAALSSCERLSSRPAIANDCPSRSSTSVSARARRERRNPEAAQAHAVREVERADFGLDLQPDGVSRDRRREVQSDAEFLEQDRHGAGRALHDRDREFAAGQEAGLLTVVGNQVRLGEALKRAASLRAPARRRRCRASRSKKNRFRKSLKVSLPSRHSVVEVGSGELLGRRTREPNSLRDGRGRRRSSLQHAPVHFGEAHLQQHLLALAAAGHLQQVDDRALRRDAAWRSRPRAA